MGDDVPTWTNRIPTATKLGASMPPDVDALKVTKGWFESFQAAVSTTDVDTLVSLFVEDGFWRDILALTWEFRTFDSATRIRQFLGDRLALSGVHNLVLQENTVLLQKPFPDTALIIATFSFDTKVGKGTGIFRLVPRPDGTFRAYTMFTNLDELKGFPEHIGPNRYSQSHSGEQWILDRKREQEFVNADPKVLIIGSGHSGLGLAARLKYLGVPALVVDRQARIGDLWRNRYDSLCLHWPIYVDHLPYLPFPQTWPLYTPAPKLAGWLEYYAEALELNVWTSTNVTKATQDQNNVWHVTVSRNGQEREFKVNHLVFATGMGDGAAKIPTYPGLDEFKGELIHSTHHKTAKSYANKKVVVIGTGNSAHDVAADCANHGLDVTMYQRTPTFVMDLRKGWKFMGGVLYNQSNPAPIERIDRVANSMPPLLASSGFAQRGTTAIMNQDKELLDGLRKAGFMLSSGINGTGALLLLRSKGGGHYFNIGASDMIIEGRIKIKNGSPIKTFTPSGIEFEDGSNLEAGVVVFATGGGPLKDHIREICGNEVADRTKTIYGVDEEGEIKGAWRPIGPRNLWYMLGSLSLSRFHSQHLALQIKAIEEGLYSSSYDPGMY